MDRVHIMEYKGVSITVIDAAHATVAQVIELLAEARTLITSCPPGSVRLFTDATQAEYSSASMAALRAFGLHNTPYILASAAIGLDNMRLLALNQVRAATGRPIRAFNERDHALEWLSAQPEAEKAFAPSWSDRSSRSTSLVLPREGSGEAS